MPVARSTIHISFNAFKIIMNVDVNGWIHGQILWSVSQLVYCKCMPR